MSHATSGDSGARTCSERDGNGTALASFNVEHFGTDGPGRAWPGRDPPAQCRSFGGQPDLTGRADFVEEVGSLPAAPLQGSGAR